MILANLAHKDILPNDHNFLNDSPLDAMADIDDEMENVFLELEQIKDTSMSVESFTKRKIIEEGEEFSSHSFL